MSDPHPEPGRLLLGLSAGAAAGQPGHYDYLLLAMANRHGLITGATGTGKTVTLQLLAEGFSRAGVPVFAADVKGDLAGLAKPGAGRRAVAERAKLVGLPYAPEAAPTVFWDLYGEQGSPIRATVAEMGPLLMSRMLELNDTQTGVLNVLFRVADERGLLLLDLKDLRAVLGYVADYAAELTTQYGNVAAATVGTIQRRLLVLENQGGSNLFGEPALEIDDLLGRTPDGRGYVNVLAADRLMRSPRLYATFLLWLLSELFERLPEVGDLDRPKLVFFFDEAHLLFDHAPKPLMTAIEQVVRLIRSKGVGIFFVTQNPLDVPDAVLGQLGNRVQHALRAFTPRDAKAVKAAADTFRQNPAFDAAAVIKELGVGEALVSTLREDGSPGVVERCWIAPPMSRVGPLTAEERRALVEAGPIYGKYDTPIDRDSAFEVLARRGAKAGGAPVPPAEPPRAAPTPPPAAPSFLPPRQGSVPPSAPRSTAWGQPAPQPPAQPEAEAPGFLDGIEGAIGDWWNGGGSSRGRMTNGQLVVRSALQSASRSVGTQVARQIMRGVLGGLQR
ncbi:helicase HerA-like domain-containing protein [Lichenibacterium dinghuense]|uniref:helicase HerA-like domain-containing protein n=1 Tax=Lichenibacterium dinghuense TaxID=2895977 RepID=UPI001F249967|nr:helicase HerA-like domain-containing protein [Lichenibacterium sp. 6Y81]